MAGDLRPATSVQELGRRIADLVKRVARLEKRLGSGAPAGRYYLSTQQAGRSDVQSFTFAAALPPGANGAATGTTNYPAPFNAEPILQLTCQANVGYAISASILTINGAGFSWRVQAQGNVPAGGQAVTVHAIAVGDVP